VSGELHHLLAALLLVVMANMAPWASGWLMRGRLGYPLDCGVKLRDGTRLLGGHKTWRGVCAGELACAVTAYLLGYRAWLGVEFASLSLAADAATSLFKRRLRWRPGAEVAGVDQVPESLVPLWILATPLQLPAWGVVVVTIIFVFLDMASRPLRQMTVQG
jgi:CDP-archaeol synthase